MSLWGTKPIKVNSFSTDNAASFNMDSSFQMIPVEELPKPKPTPAPAPVSAPVPIQQSIPKPSVTLDILQTLMPPGVIKKNAHLINLILKK